MGGACSSRRAGMPVSLPRNTVGSCNCSVGSFIFIDNEEYGFEVILDISLSGKRILSILTFNKDNGIVALAGPKSCWESTRSVVAPSPA